MMNKNEIVEGLKNLGINMGDIVEVHSSLSSLGNIEGGATTVINALIYTVGEEGTLVMSAYPVSLPQPLSDEDKQLGIHWKVKILERNSAEKTGMGAVVDEFIKRNDVKLGYGIHRTCAWGKDKDKFIDGYKHLEDVNGKVLLLGVGIDRCSSLHLAEDIPLPADIQKYFDIPDNILGLYPPEKWSVGLQEPPADAWGKVFIWTKENKLVKETKIGNATCYSFPIKPLLNQLRSLRKLDPYGLFGVQK